MGKLNISLVHLDVRYGEQERNRKELLRLNKAAAENGAGIIVNTELGLSGYSYGSREEIARVAERADGPTVEALSAIASAYGCYIVFGYAEEDGGTGIFYNSAAVIGRDGTFLFSYRKVTAEVRWACAGSPLQPNTFDTPWGRAGVMICSDSYYGAIPRMSALRGADLLLVPANWPGGSLDPRELWQARACENGFFLAACNRGGKDKTMSCEDAYSCVCGPDGKELFAEKSSSSKIFTVELPLENGRLPSRTLDRMSARIPEQYGGIYLDMRYANDMTAYCQLPSPGEFRVACQPADPSVLFAGEDMIETIIATTTVHGADLLVLPAGNARSVDRATESLVKTARTLQCAICAGIIADGCFTIVFVERDGAISMKPCADSSLRWIDLPNARVALASKDELYHPELGIAFAKQGCDVVAVSSSRLDEQDRMVLGARSIEQVAVAASGGNRAFLAEPPEGHHRWAEAHTEYPGKPCVMTLDTSRLRRKQFYERLDYELLLRKGGPRSGKVSEREPSEPAAIRNT
ncbi:carbon-nitrogen hydrolase [Prosthecochloris sp. GSB1]|uniref:nitrilase-related carbon-nitrogen hydrolase n=1 Tax=Prosthecochloris sp. GSB1 TaxID=281093 RepID=UPI000B8C8D1D|nr:nitrilase-related carbon-nitrogen hydrolase [Prosthecochloris sp. GSB1]ASQ90360.1 carbon-nitrogen hydrolase [Prosthecochloris sp. GSB1]